MALHSSMTLPTSILDWPSLRELEGRRVGAGSRFVASNPQYRLCRVVGYMQNESECHAEV